MDSPPQIQDKAPKPPGLLPKNVQAWLLIGLAFLMVAIMWLTGGKKPAAPVKTLVPRTPEAPLEVNETKITEMQNRIEQLQHEQLVAQNALSEQARLLASPTENPKQLAPENAGGASSDSHTEDPIEAERKRRAYVSLFSSNLALSYRSPGVAMPAPATDTSSEMPSQPSRPDAAEIAPLSKAIEPSAPPTAPIESHSAEGRSDGKEGVREIATPGAKTYVLFEGTILETVLINRLDGQFAGPIECLLSTSVYSNDRQHLLVPAGSKLLGETKKVDTFGQTRLAVIFHRVIMPDGYSVSLDQFKGLDQIGDGGLRDQVNNHYLRIFGVSLAIGALGAVAEAGTAGALTASSSDLMRQGFAQSTAQSSAQILDKFLNVLPTITIREGHRVKVYLSGDLALPDYNNHTLPSDL